MKKKVFYILILSVLPLFAPAQEYVPFPTKNTIWSEYFFDDAFLPARVYHYFALKDNDTIINNLEYHKLYCSFDTVFTEDDLCGGLREENKRVYYYSLKYLDYEILNEPVPVDTEIILYDFNLQLGDTIASDVYRIRGCEEFPCEIYLVHVDSILIGGEYRKQYNFGLYFKNQYDIFQDPWVEGVGNLSGLLSDIGSRPTSNWNSWLICMIEDGDVLYHYSGNCYNSNENSVQILENNSEIKIAPNPVESALKVDFGNSDYQKLTLSDLSGRPVRQYLVDGLKTLTIEREGLTKGIYLLSAFDRAGSLQTLKILFK